MPNREDDKAKRSGIFDRSAKTIEFNREAIDAALASGKHRDIERVLDKFELLAEELLDYAENHGKAGWPPDLGDLGETVSDAVTLRQLVNDVRRLLTNDSLQHEELAFSAIHLGQVSQRLLVRSYEPGAKSGERCLDGARQGGSAKKLDESEKRRRRKEWQVVVEEVHAKEANRTRDVVLKKAAAIIKRREGLRTLSAKTVSRYTTYPESS